MDRLRQRRRSADQVRPRQILKTSRPGMIGATFCAIVFFTSTGTLITRSNAAEHVGATVTAPANVASEPDEIEAVLSLGSGGRELSLEGDLMGGVATRVSELLAAHPEVRRLQLTSDGGLVGEAMLLAAQVRARGLETYVQDHCVSACTLVFVYGRKRHLAAGAQLGFHAPYEEDAVGQRFTVDPTPERKAYLEAGIAPAFTARALAQPSDDVWLPSPAELLEAGVVTDLVPSTKVAASILDATGPADHGSVSTGTARERTGALTTSRRPAPGGRGDQPHPEVGSPPDDVRQRTAAAR